MKYISFIFLAMLFAGCKSQQGSVEITGTAKGITFGSVTVRDQANNNVFTADIESGKFDFKKPYLQYSGYYKILYAARATKGVSRHIEVYLEPGTYTITIDPENINDYPRITSSSALQTQLSAYYALGDSIKHDARKKVIEINNQMQAIKNSKLDEHGRIALSNKLQAEELKINDVDELNIFDAFMRRYPDNAIAAHILLQLNYQNEPVKYYKIFQKFSAEAKESPDGVELGAKLKPLSKLAEGSPAPAITGTTVDGKELDIKALNKKVILLDFWRSTNGTSRDNHGDIIRDLLPQYGPKGFGVVSVSFDTDRDKWQAAVTLDKMKWIQISDLKGDDSPNGPTWGIKSIPAYYLLDGAGHIITRVADFNDVQPAIENYLKKH